jgi:hypothetical protein
MRKLNREGWRQGWGRDKKEKLHYFLTALETLIAVLIY